MTDRELTHQHDLLSVFRRPPAPLTLLLNDCGIVVYYSDTKNSSRLSARLFSVSSSIETTLVEVSEWISNERPQHSNVVQLLIGGKFSYTVFKSAQETSDVDVVLSRQRGGKGTLYDVRVLGASSKVGPSLIQTVALDEQIIITAKEILGEHSLEMVSVDSLVAHIATLPSIIEDDGGVGFVTPFEFVAFLHRESAIPETVTDVGYFLQKDKTVFSALTSLVKKTVPVADSLVSSVGFVFSWKRLLKSRPIAGLSRDIWCSRIRYLFHGGVSRFMRAGVAVAVLFALSGIWQSARINRANANTSQIHALRIERDSLLAIQTANSLQSKRNQLIVNLSSSTLLGILGQKKVHRGFIESVNVTAESHTSGKAIIKGVAENEAEAFAYLDFLRKQLPGFSVSLESIAPQRSYRRAQENTNKAFKISIRQ